MASTGIGRRNAAMRAGPPGWLAPAARRGRAQRRCAVSSLHRARASTPHWRVLRPLELIWSTASTNAARTPVRALWLSGGVVSCRRRAQEQRPHKLLLLCTKPVVSCAAVEIVLTGAVDGRGTRSRLLAAAGDFWCRPPLPRTIAGPPATSGGIPCPPDHGSRCSTKRIHATRVRHRVLIGEIPTVASRPSRA